VWFLILQTEENLPYFLRHVNRKMQTVGRKRRDRYILFAAHVDCKLRTRQSPVALSEDEVLSGDSKVREILTKQVEHFQDLTEQLQASFRKAVNDDIVLQRIAFLRKAVEYARIRRDIEAIRSGTSATKS